MKPDRPPILDALGATRLLGMHDDTLVSWDAAPPANSGPGSDLASLALAQHFCNFSLWRLEDEARRRDVADAVIAETKRAIDRWNQLRNDRVEQIDRALLAQLSGVDTSAAALHSETAGMMVDRLSILALKIFHMRRYAEDQADPAIAAECRDKLAWLVVQRKDLSACLDALLADFAEGRRYFKLYRQFKAYNDPRLNPALKGPKA